MKKSAESIKLHGVSLPLKYYLEITSYFCSFVNCCGIQAISTSVEFYLPEDHLELDYQASLPIDRYQQNIA
ncbi:hypothetical protein PNV70_06055 [Ruminococcus bicirculans]|jgi:hypothetical protein|uniref:Uncharacterized protein n=1 Tax=Ruminococcus bicirculans (ex Wegman et al. 2014) TaxID=1160721 RepID=A0AAW6E1N9_9FIRM|nr:hypothetical protein [Ruminococcus bicirculans (ex Wegman et al. 2014)]MDB8741629.1 hypothetical protein [Ruminococcus bicirculans (ex Wegman et al. 2014)]